MTSRMSRRTVVQGMACSATLGLLAVPLACSAQDETLRPLYTMAGMNVFRRHAVPTERMFWFYGDVLGFAPLDTYDVGSVQVSRLRFGAAELKLTAREERRHYVAGGPRDATGLRLLGFFFPDQAALEQRFRSRDLPVPSFQPLADSGQSVALLQDPDGQWVQLTVAPGQDEDFYRRVEVGLTVADLDRSRAFYQDFLGLDALPPMHDPLFDTQAYRFEYGSTLITLRSFGDDLPADTGSGGMQYVVSDIEAVDRLARERKVVVDPSIHGVEGFRILFVWLDDPDGIINYFAQPGAG